MLQHYKILTVTHQQTKLNEIGKFILQLDNSSIEERLLAIKTAFNLDGLYYSATCNRVLFLFTANEEVEETFITKFFTAVNAELTNIEIQENVQSFNGIMAIQHLLEVASSINSMVIGERQILGQLRTSFDQCLAAKLINDDLRLLFQRVVLGAKDVYTNTRIGEKPVSVVSLAIQQMLGFNLPKDARILLIGAGQTNNLISKFLVKHEYAQVDVFNRSIGKAALLAKKFDGEGFTLAQLPEYKKGFDCIFICTAATEPILTKELTQQLLNGESLSKKVIVDLSIPYNTSNEIIAETGDRFIEIEGLRELAKENMSFREQEINAARQLLETHLEEFSLIFRQRQLEVALRQVPTEIKAVRHKAVNEVFRKEMDELDDETKALVDTMLLYMEKKCISIPMRAAREALI